MSRIMDQNGRLFGKISVIDVLVIAVVVVMGVALYVKSAHNEITSTTTTNQTITYQVLASGVRTYVADAVRVGDEMFDQDRSSGGTLGRIVAIERLPGGSLAEFNDGTMETVPVEDGVNLLLTVEGSGLVGEKGRCTLNRVYDLGVNSSRNFCTKFAQFTATVTDIF